jgi:predicted Zn-dependent peptidase
VDRIRLVGVFERHQLPNGVRVVTAPVAHAQSVSCVLMFAAGSRYETKDTNGIAHFAEHMFFKGTEKRPSSRDLAGEIDAIGGEFNAFTGKEYTAYYVRCAAESRSTALDVLVDMVRRSKFDPEEIDREKGVIVEEMNMYFDTPRDFVGGVYDDLLYGDQPLGWDIIGTKETVRAATRDTFLGYTDRWYKPERLVVGVGGRIDGDLIGELTELLGDLEPAPTGEPLPVQVAPSNGNAVRVHHKASDQAHIVLGARSYPLEHPDRYVLQLLAGVLGGGMSSRLFIEVRERRGLAYYVYGANHAYTDAGSLYAQAGVDITRIDEAITTVVDELKKIVDEPVPSEELEKARSFAKGRFVLQLESPHGLTLFGLRKEILENRVVEQEEVLAALDAVTVEDVQRVAQDVLGGGLNLALIGPFDDPSRFEKLLGV